MLRLYWYSFNRTFRFSQQIITQIIKFRAVRGHLPFENYVEMTCRDSCRFLHLIRYGIRKLKNLLPYVQTHGVHKVNSILVQPCMPAEKLFPGWNLSQDFRIDVTIKHHNSNDNENNGTFVNVVLVWQVLSRISFMDF